MKYFTKNGQSRAIQKRVFVLIGLLTVVMLVLQPVVASYAIGPGPDRGPGPDPGPDPGAFPVIVPTVPPPISPAGVGGVVSRPPP